MIATTPISAAWSMVSLNGKKASDAITEPSIARPASAALIAATRALYTRLIWPAPMPSVWPPRQKTMALDFTNLTIFQLNNRSSSCFAVALLRVTAVRSLAATTRSSRVWASKPPETCFSCSAESFAGAADAVLSTRILGFLDNTLSASSETSGAMMTSTNCRSMIACAVSADKARLNAMMPPYAEVGSVA